MISLEYIGLLIFAFLAVVLLSRLIVGKISKYTSRRWAPYSYLVIALFPLIELAKILFGPKDSSIGPFLVFWLSFLGFCLSMFVLEVRKAGEKRNDAS